MSFFIGNQDKFQTNSSVHSINTRNKHHLHRPVAKLSCFQKGATYSGIRIFNNLPRSITSLKNENPQFKVDITIFLYAHSFYSVNEFFTCTDDMYYWPIWLCKILHCNNFVCLYAYEMFHILLSCDSLRDLWKVCTYVCIYVRMYVKFHRFNIKIQGYISHRIHSHTDSCKWSLLSLKM